MLSPVVWACITHEHSPLLNGMLAEEPARIHCMLVIDASADSITFDDPDAHDCDWGVCGQWED